MSVTEAEFETAIQAAISRRETKYSNFYALHFRWEDDNTDASRDGESFQDLVHLMGFPFPDVHVIPKGDPLPGFEVQHRVASLFIKAGNAQGRSIVIIHYAGHGNANDLNELELCSQPGKRIAANGFLLNITTDMVMGLDVPIDVIIIFDCCYSFLASRNGSTESRNVEILSAGDERDPVAFAAGTKNSLTSKLLIEIRSRAQRGDKLVEMADVMNALQQSSPVKKPSYTAKLGIGSITLPLNTMAPAVTIPPTPKNVQCLLATFSVHVSKTFNKQELKDLVRWLEESPKGKSATLKLESVKATNSMLFIFESSRLCFLRICGLPGVSLICENTPEDFSWLLHPTP
ncbi:hypothetical protein PRK78_006292 [Emydomyces testavorans]|uniref:Uncharacterized protein n=1 Tax=Emydomyces testavorans TaxID=2070801 RepID=A0AAF0DL36_9EURO|nr:hypothetical protein PRK78_006292 [Emydomyces testavorans]